MPDATTLGALTLLMAVGGLAGVKTIQALRRAKANGEASMGDNERRHRSCLVLDERAAGIETRVSVVEAGLDLVRADVAGIRSEAGERHGEVMRALGSITGEMRVLRDGKV